MVAHRRPSLARRVIWKSLMFNGASKKDKLLDKAPEAALIGAHLSKQKGVPDCDIYVTSTAALTTAIIGMMCRAVPIVSPAYVDEVLRLGALPASDPASLEANFRLPDPQFFKPAIQTENEVVGDEELLAALTPDPDRPTLLKGCTTLFIDTGAVSAAGWLWSTTSADSTRRRAGHPRGTGHDCRGMWRNGGARSLGSAHQREPDSSTAGSHEGQRCGCLDQAPRSHRQAADGRPGDSG